MTRRISQSTISRMRQRAIMRASVSESIRMKRMDPRSRFIFELDKRLSSCVGVSAISTIIGDFVARNIM